jgi:hypothetical protein
VGNLKFLVNCPTPPFELEPGGAKTRDAVDQDRQVAFQMVGEENERAVLTQANR